MPADPTDGHLAAERSDRGFLSMPPLADAFGPDALRILEASTADAPHIWLRVERPPEPDQSAVVMLTAEQAWQLKEQIEWLLEHHYQGDARVVAGRPDQPTQTTPLFEGTAADFFCAEDDAGNLTTVLMVEKRGDHRLTLDAADRGTRVTVYATDPPHPR